MYRKLELKLASLSLLASATAISIRAASSHATASAFVPLSSSWRGQHWQHWQHWQQYEYGSSSRKRRRCRQTPIFHPSSSFHSSFATSCSRNPNVLDGKDGITSASVSSSTHESDGCIIKSSSINTAQTFILVDTRHPGNVGAAARAMKTMGFSNLILVTPHDERVLGRKKCIDGASGALDVLRNATVVDSLDEALQQCHTTIVNEGGDVISSEKLVVCGTGMPVDMQNDRPKVTNYAAPRPYFQQILSSEKDETFDQDDDNAIADEISNGDQDDNGIHMIFIFGNEKYGMKAEDIDKCHVMLGIPTNPAFGSLNVASAVQLIAYDWREAIGGFGGPLTSPSAAT